MASTAISYGTATILAELKRDGWTVTANQESSGRIGVLATDENGAGIFIQCPTKDAAWRLLERVDDEVAGVV